MKIVNETNVIYISRVQEKVPIKVFSCPKYTVEVYADNIICNFSDATVTLPYKNVVGVALCNGLNLIYEVDNEIIVETVRVDGTTSVLYLKANLEAYPLIREYDKMILIESIDDFLLVDHTKQKSVSGNKKYIHIANAISKLNYLYSDTSYLVGEDLVIPINNSNKAVRIDNATKTLEVYNYELESYFSNPSLCVEGGNESTSASEVGLSSIVINDKNIIHVDNIDYNGFTIGFTTASTHSATLISDDIFVINNEGLFMIGKHDLCVFKANVNFNTKGFKIYQKEEELYAYSSSHHYKLEKSTNTLTITSYCIDGAGDLIGIYDEVIVKAPQATVKAPIIKGYMLDDEPTKTVNVTDEDMLFVHFKYSIEKTLCKMTVKHMCFDTVLREDHIYGLYGEKYEAQRYNISGYSFSHSSNAAGVFNKENDECFFYFVRSDSTGLFDSILDVTINSSASSKINRTIPFLKKDNLAILPFDVSFHESKEDSFIISCTDNLAKYEKEYVLKEEHKCKEIIPIDVRYNGTKIYEDYISINDKEEVEHNLPKEMIPISKIEKTGIVEVDLLKEATLTVLVDGYDKSIISNLLSFNKGYENIPMINGYKFEKEKSYNMQSLNINEYTYRKTRSRITIEFKDIDTGEYLDGYRINGEVGTFHSLSPMVIDGYTPLFEPIELEFLDRDYIFTEHYSKTKIVCQYNYKDLFSKKTLNTDIFCFPIGTHKMPEVNKDYNVVLNEAKYHTHLTESCEFDIYVSENYKVSFSQTNFIPDGVGVSILSSNIGEQRMILKGDFNLNHPVFVTENCPMATKEYLNTNGFAFNVLQNIPDTPFVLVTGDVDSWKREEVKELPTNCFHIKANLKYKNLKTTITLAKNTPIKNFVVPHNREANIESTLKVEPLYHNINGDLGLYFNVLRKTPEFEKLNIDMIDPISLDIINNFTKTIETSGTFNKVTYRLNGGVEISSNSKILINTGEYLTSFSIELTAFNEIGDSTKPLSDYVEIYTKDINKIDKESPSSMPSVTRVNNRFKGPRESLKAINFSDGINKACDNLKKIFKGEN